jgi:tetratricopeptide (TPR) repeat protein
VNLSSARKHGRADLLDNLKPSDYTWFSRENVFRKSRFWFGTKTTPLALVGSTTAFPQTSERRIPRHALTILGLLTFALPAYCAQTSTNTASSIGAALRAKDYGQALELVRSSLEHSPYDPKLLTLEGLALSGLGKTDDALAAYDAALKVSPDYLPALEGAAQIEYNSGGRHAAALLERILEIRPDDPTSHAMLAVLSYRGHDCKQAVLHFRASGQLLFSQNAALEEYAFCLITLGQVKDAIPLYEAIRSGEPQDEKAIFRLADAQLLADQPGDAIATLQPLLDKQDVGSDVLDLASAAYEKSGNTPRAVQLLRTAIVHSPDNPKLYLDFSTLCFDHSSFDVGIDMLSVGLSRLPRSAPLHLARGILYIQLANYDKGQADFEAAERLDPHQTFSSESESLAKIQENRHGDALEVVRSRLKAHPNDPVLLYLLADALVRSGAQPGSPEFREALSAASRAAQLKPDLTLARDLLGSLYFKQGEMGKAIEQSRAALRSDPKDQEALYRLTQALRKTGKTAEIPALLKQLADLQQQDRSEEESRSRYKLVEPSPSTGSPASQN